MITRRIQNVYGDFLRSFKVFLDKVSRHSLNKIEWNYGSKTLEYYYMMNGNESFEFPVAVIDIQDVQPVDGVSPISRNPKMHWNISPHNLIIAENLSNEQQILLDKRWVNLMFNVTINTEDISQMLMLHDLFISQLPMNFMFYDYTYYTYIEVTDFVKTWDFDYDTIENVFLMFDKTYRYEPNKHYKESNEDFFETNQRDRTLGGDAYPDMEGLRYFSMLKSEPIIKLTSITQQTEKESNMHSLTLSFEARIEVPNAIMWKQEFTVESIELVLDTVNANGIAHEYPILTDIPENFLTNKNISRGILLFPENFVIPENPEYIVPEQELNPDPTKYAHLMVPEPIMLGPLIASLWAVEDVTEISSSRFFIPLKHAIVTYEKDADGHPINTLFFFKEMQWFEQFDFQNKFNFLKLVLFSQD